MYSKMNLDWLLAVLILAGQFVKNPRKVTRSPSKPPTKRFLDSHEMQSSSVSLKPPKLTLVSIALNCWHTCELILLYVHNLRLWNSEIMMPVEYNEAIYFKGI